MMKESSLPATDTKKRGSPFCNLKWTLISIEKFHFLTFDHIVFTSLQIISSVPHLLIHIFLPLFSFTENEIEFYMTQSSTQQHSTQAKLVMAISGRPHKILLGLVLLLGCFLTYLVFDMQQSGNHLQHQFPLQTNAKYTGTNKEKRYVF